MKKSLLAALVLCALAPAGLAQPVSTSSSMPNIAPIAIGTTGTQVCFAAQPLASGLAICGFHASGSGNATVVVQNSSTIWVGGTGVTIGGAFGVLPGACAPSAAVNNAALVCINGVAGDGAIAGGN